MKSIVITFFTTLLAVGVALAADDPLLVGTWEGTSDNARGETIEIRADGTALVQGQAIRWSVTTKGQLDLDVAGEQASGRYAADRTTLVIELAGERYTYRRTSKPPAGGGETGETGGDPWARSFTGDGVALALTRAGEGYAGTLELDGNRYEIKATVEGDTLTGSFGLGFPFKAVMTGANTLDLTCAGKTRSLTAGAGGESGPTPGGEPPPALTGVDQGPASRYEHPRKWYSFDMPSGWSVHQQTEDGLLLNPGLTENDTLDAIITVAHGTLEEEERSAAINELVDHYTPQIRQGLAAQGIHLDEPKTKAQKVLIGEVPGAVQVFSGKTSAGAKITIWFGGLVKREYYLSVTAIVVDGKESKFLPRVKRIFTSLRPTPPQLNTKLMTALAGRRFAKNTTNSSGSFSTIYYLYEGGAVKKEMIMSGGPVGGSTEESGRFEVMGEQIFFYFKDGQQSGTVVIEGGQIAGLRFGGTLYSPH